jgi:hypothetical protein
LIIPIAKNSPDVMMQKYPISGINRVTVDHVGCSLLINLGIPKIMPSGKIKLIKTDTT